MPIKAENRARYPADWKAIRTAILERARYACEWPGCGAIQYSVGYWTHEGFRWVGERNWYPTYAEARQAAADNQPDDPDEPKNIVIVLTVAHLDHTPENCAPENLRAWCQRHHLAYDHKHHIGNAQATRRAKLGNLELEL